MQHVTVVSKRRPVAPADALGNASAVISLLSSIVTLLGQVGSLLGISFEDLIKDATGAT